MSNAAKLGKMLKAANGPAPTWSEQILANPVARFAAGAIADPLLGTGRLLESGIKGGLSAAGVPGANSLPANFAAMNDHLDALIEHARMATGRTNPESGGGTGPDYYRGAGDVAGALAVASKAGLLSKIIKHGILGLPEEVMDNPLVGVATAGAPLMGGSIAGTQALARQHGGK